MKKIILNIKYWIRENLEKIGVKIIQERIIKGYDASCYFDWIFFDSIKAFCEQELKEEHILEFNKEVAKVYKKTINLIEKAQGNPSLNLIHSSNEVEKAREYIIKNIEYYWS